MTYTRLHVADHLGRLCMAALGSACLAATSAPCAPMTADHLPAEGMSQIGEICHDVMGLRDGVTAQFEACRESLTHSLAARSERETMNAARSACEAQGLKPNTLALSECKLHLPSGFPKETRFASIEDSPPVAAPPKSYFSASSDEIHRREQEACARIGLDPSDAGFAQCVANLQAGMFDADNPMH